MKFQPLDREIILLGLRWQFWRGSPHRRYRQLFLLKLESIEVLLGGQCVTMDCRIRGKERTQSSPRNGRLGRDAPVRHTKNGRVVANFSVAVDESYKDLRGEWHQKTEWHRVPVWEELAQTVSSGFTAESASVRRGAPRHPQLDRPRE
jgi:hypothetical protein